MELNLVGPFRSGTNWLRALLELNHDVRVVPAAGFKHHPVPASLDGPVVGVQRRTVRRQLGPDVAARLDDAA